MGHAERVKTYNEDCANIIGRKAVSLVLACWVSLAAKCSEIRAGHCIKPKLISLHQYLPWRILEKSHSVPFSVTDKAEELSQTQM